MTRTSEMIALFCGALVAVALHTGPALSAADATTDNEHELVYNGDHVVEWRNPKLTELTQLPELAAATKTGEDEPILIFKHSTACPISARAAERMDELLTESEEELPKFFMVEVIESRPVSNTIEAVYEVKHESPQLLLIKDGKAVWSADHDDITAEALLGAIKDNDAQPKEEPEDKSEK